MSNTMTALLEQEHATPALHEAIAAAQDEAARMNASEVSPEHLFLGVLAQDSEQLAETFSALRLNQAVLRTRVATAFPPHNTLRKGDGKDLPLSKEAYACLEWAISFAAYQHVSSLQPEHMLLGSVRHQRLQPLLALFLVNAGSSVPSYIMECSGRAYTATMDQYIFSRIRRQVAHGDSTSLLSRFERPTVLFSDIAGFHDVKQELREVIDFLRNPQLVQQNMRLYLYGLLLVGLAGNTRTLLGRAIAGEAGVPFLFLSLPLLFEMTRTSGGGTRGIFGDVYVPHTAYQAEEETRVHRGCRIIHDFFEQGNKATPCILYLDELEALARPEMKDVCESWQHQLRSEINGCNACPAMAVLATVRRPEHIEQLPLIAPFFDHRATLDGTVIQSFEEGLVLCSACHQEVPAHWKYCGFCGTTVARTCSQCGTIRPEVQGVHFCHSCGGNLEESNAEIVSR
ncbi:MAG: AAA family ATPase [Chloroflexota bacterium]|nr:AAA family ATPase [Chloroflexota bacterium]